ncbi:acyl-CoA thioesterase [Mangrovitalea sediminis]|uniref:acyl-CoA thioesterase n=1 Tax=Mangrovitalea sediminis TaxID=1982043 RepID=UPI000BE4E857|nr:acyl-CoA thioesterase [Mangrovitalea sediminis]
MTEPSMQRKITLRFLAEPGDVNFGGKVHGGAVMKWIDQAGYTCAAGWSGRYCVTVYVGGIRFFRPIRIGEVVDIDAKIVYTGKTSMQIAVDVHAADPQSRERHRTTHCIVVFVAVDDSGNPITVPKWEPETEEDIELHQYAQKLMALRQSINQEMNAFLAE